MCTIAIIAILFLFFTARSFLVMRVVQHSNFNTQLLQIVVPVQLVIGLFRAA